MVNGVFWHLIAKYLPILERCQMSQSFDFKRLCGVFWQTWRLGENKRRLLHTHKRTRDAPVRARVLYILSFCQIYKNKQKRV